MTIHGTGIRAASQRVAGGPQFGRPDADNTVGAWTTTPLFDKIDETPASDSDKIHSGNNPENDICRVEISAVTDPVGNVNHHVRFRVQKSASGGRNIILVVSLRQGTTTVIRSETFANLANGWQAIDWLLTGTQADNITDYSDLQFQLDADFFGSGAGRRGECSFMEFECPAA